VHYQFAPVNGIETLHNYIGTYFYALSILKAFCKDILIMRLHTPETSGPALARFVSDAVSFTSLEITMARRITIQIVRAMNMSPANSWTVRYAGYCDSRCFNARGSATDKWQCVSGAQSGRLRNMQVVGNAIKVHTIDRAAGSALMGYIRKKRASCLSVLASK
jgi:hypothetical protein